MNRRDRARRWFGRRLFMLALIVLPERSRRGLTLMLEVGESRLDYMATKLLPHRDIDERQKEEGS